MSSIKLAQHSNNILNTNNTTLLCWNRLCLNITSKLVTCLNSSQSMTPSPFLSNFLKAATTLSWLAACTCTWCLHTVTSEHLHLHLQAGAGAAWRGGTGPGLPRAAQQLQTANIMHGQSASLVHQKWISTLSTLLLGHILCYLHIFI